MYYKEPELVAQQELSLPLLEDWVKNYTAVVQYARQCMPEVSAVVQYARQCMPEVSAVVQYTRQCMHACVRACGVLQHSGSRRLRWSDLTCFSSASGCSRWDAEDLEGHGRQCLALMPGPELRPLKDPTLGPLQVDIVAARQVRWPVLAAVPTSAPCLGASGGGGGSPASSATASLYGLAWSLGERLWSGWALGWVQQSKGVERNGVLCPPDQGRKAPHCGQSQGGV